MNFTKRFGLVAAAAAALVGTMAFSAPASAASCLSLSTTTARPTYSYVLKLNWSQLFGAKAKTSTTQSNPSTQQTAAPAETTNTTAPAETGTTAPAETNTQVSTEGLTAAEQQMVDLVNSERTKNGLKPLQVDMELTKLARMKSQDMINLGYFDHTSPTYGSPFDMMKTYGVTYRTAGENIAGNQSVQAAHTALMNSAGHRANILNSNFTHIGIGIVKGGQYGMMFTQMFVGR